MIRIFKILAVFLFLQQINLFGQVSGERSVLSSGKWFKIAVTAEGIYRIDYSRLKQLGLENPSCPKIFGNNAGQLPYYNNGSGQEYLKETSIYISGDDS